MPNQEHERERDQTHSYWYIPSASRENYSLLVMESAGMMKMATGEGSPSGKVPERAPERFFVATEACGGGTPDLGYVSGGFCIYRRVWRREQVRGPHEKSTRHRGAPSTLVGPTGLPSGNSLFQYFLYFPKKISIDFQRIPRTFISAQKQHHGSSAENIVSPG